MSNKDIKNKWLIFLEEYHDYFLNNYEKWYNNLNKLEEYIIEKNKLPNRTIDKNITFLRRWYDTNQKNFKNNLNIMKNKNIRKDWDIFINKYNNIFNKS